MVFFNPTSNVVEAENPNSEVAFAVSSMRRGCPSGFDLSQIIFPLKPLKAQIFSAKLLIDISKPAPKFTGSLLSYFSLARIIPRAASSTYKNSLVGLPVPQTVIEFCLFFWHQRLS